MTTTTCIVTGASSGIGLQTCIGLARQGRHIVMVARDPARTETARRQVWQAVPDAKVDVLLADLASLAAVRTLASTILRHYERVDVLVNNAGMFSMKRTVTVDGYETTFAVNHLAPFLLTNLLFERMKVSGNARIVTVASIAHQRAHLDFDDLQSTRGYSWLRVYSRSKLANILFTRELARRLQGTPVTANCLHPGLVATNIARGGLAAITMKLARPLLISAERGARTSIYLATSAEVEGVTGEYFDKCEIADTSAEAKDMKEAARLWEVSARMVGLEE